MENNVSRDEFLMLVKWVKENYGVNLEQKATLVEGRLWNVIKKKGFNSLKEYFNYAVADKSGMEIKTLLTRLTTNYTYFMREDQHYAFLVDTILPNLARTLSNKDLRI